MICRVLSTAIAIVCVAPVFAQEASPAKTAAAPPMKQQTFDSAEAAAQAVIDAAEQHDSAKLMAILGPGARDILTSGKSAQDQSEQSEFARLARSKHRLEISSMNPNRAILAIGDEDWPFPVPIVRKNGKWGFDASQAAVEMRARRIGTHELDAIEICYGYIDAQRKFASEDRDHDGTLEYAPHLMATAGKNDGLYWEGSGEPLIPKALAQAAWEGAQKGTAKPYHGYYFRILRGQGPDAPGGEHTYVVKQELIGGFGLVAWPAEYGVSGIHTFIVNQDGIVYEKDIAPAAGQAAPVITRYNPDKTWKQVE